MRSQQPMNITISSNTFTIFNFPLVQELKLAEEKLSVARDKLLHAKNQYESATDITKEYLKQIKELQEKTSEALKMANSNAGMETMQKANQEDDLHKKMELGIKGINLIAEEKRAFNEVKRCKNQLEKLSNIYMFAVNMIDVAGALFKEAYQECDSLYEAFTRIKDRFDKQQAQVKINLAWASLLSTEDADIEKSLFKNVI